MAQFHEWQTGAGLLYLEQHQPRVGTVYSPHMPPTVGRSIAGNNQVLYSHMAQMNGDQKARELNIIAKHSLEKAGGYPCRCVYHSKRTYCKRVHCSSTRGLIDVVLPNGFEDSFVPV